MSTQLDRQELARRDQLVRDLDKLIQTAQETASLEHLVAPYTAELIRELETLLVGSRPWTDRDQQALRVVAQLHFVRWRAFSDEVADIERLGCLRWALELMTIAPEQVPHLVRSELAAERPAHPSYERGSESFLDFMNTWTEKKLRDAKAEIHRALEEVTLKDPHLPLYWHLYGTIHTAEYDRTGDIRCLTIAVKSFRSTIESCSLDDPHMPIYLSDLGSALRGRFQQLGNQDDLTASINSLESAVEATLPGYPDREKFLSQLSNSLRERFELSGSRSDLDRAVDLSRHAVQAAAGAEAHIILSSLANSLTTHYSVSRDPQDLDEAINALIGAIDGTPKTHPNLPTYESNLVLALHLRHQRFGKGADIEDAVSISRRALSRARTAELNTHLPRQNLAVILKTRFDRNGQLSGLDEAISLYQKVMREESNIQAEALVASNLGAARVSRYRQTLELSDLDQAVTLFRRATDGATSQRIARYKLNLGSALLTRYERLHNLSDLYEALLVLQESVNATPREHDELSDRLHGLATAFLLRFESDYRLEDLNHSIGIGTEAVDRTPRDHPDLAIYLQGLASSLFARVRLAGDLADAERACSALKRAAELPAATPQVRLNAASTRGAAEAESGNLAIAVEAYQVAVDLLPLVVWHGLDRISREHILSRLSDLASQAASCALLARETQQAVNMLEAARGVLWSQALQRRADLGRLRTSHPELVDALESVRVLLDHPAVLTSTEADEAFFVSQELLRRAGRSH